MNEGRTTRHRGPSTPGEPIDVLAGLRGKSPGWAAVRSLAARAGPGAGVDGVWLVRHWSRWVSPFPTTSPAAADQPLVTSMT
jgi:hypothetical protein